MRYVLVLFLGLALVFGFSPNLEAVEPLKDNGTRPLEEIVVTGKRPGPPLWRVSTQDGEHVMWIFGTLLPLPKKLEWDSNSVEAILAESSEFIGPPGVSASVSNPFKALGVLRRIGKMEQLPKGTKLKNVLEPVLYERLLATKAQYAPRNNKLLRLRAIAAANKLTDKAFAKVGLSRDDKVVSKLEQLAKKNRLTITKHEQDIEIEEALTIIGNVTPAAGASCLSDTLDSITGDIRQALLRAEAWAAGDATLLKQFDYPDLHESCVRDVYNSSSAKQLMAQSQADWLTSAERALSANVQTFAALPVRELIHPEGLLARLAARGFQVRGQ